MSKLLKRLHGLLFPGVDDPDGGGDPAAAGGDPGADPNADAGPDDSNDDLDIDLDFDEPTPPARGASQDSDRLARLEAEVAAGRRAADEARARFSSTPTVDPEFQREEERLRNPETPEIERWQIRANRTLRETQDEARRAMFQAQDVADQTRFQAGVATDPRRAKYAERVEQAVQAERAQGRNASREAVYFYMLGKDIAEGKLKPKVKAKTPAADVPRGRTPAVRSNVPSGRGLTEHQKRAARLENVNI
jgi:hypothetical protein